MAYINFHLGIDKKAPEFRLTVNQQKATATWLPKRSFHLGLPHNIRLSEQNKDNLYSLILVRLHIDCYFPFCAAETELNWRASRMFDKSKRWFKTHDIWEMVKGTGIFFFFNPGGILICQELWRSWGFTRLASWQFSWIQFHRCWRKTWDSETEDRSLQQSHPLQHQHFFVPAPTGQCKTAPDNACTPWVALQERKPVHRKSHPFMIVCKQTHPTVFLGDDRYYLSTHIFEIEQKAVSAFSRRTSRKRRDPSLFSTVTTFCHFRGKKQCPVGENLPKATFMVDREIFLLKKKQNKKQEAEQVPSAVESLRSWMWSGRNQAAICRDCSGRLIFLYLRSEAFNVTLSCF